MPQTFFLMLGNIFRLMQTFFTLYKLFLKCHDIFFKRGDIFLMSKTFVLNDMILFKRFTNFFYKAWMFFKCVRDISKNLSKLMFLNIRVKHFESINKHKIRNEKHMHDKPRLFYWAIDHKPFHLIWELRYMWHEWCVHSFFSWQMCAYLTIYLSTHLLEHILSKHLVWYPWFPVTAPSVVGRQASIVHAPHCRLHHRLSGAPASTLPQSRTLLYYIMGRKE